MMKEYKDLSNEKEKVDSSTKITIEDNGTKKYASIDSLKDEKYYLERRVIDIESEIRYCVTRIRDIKGDKKQLVDSIREKDEDIYEIEKLVDKHNKNIEENILPSLDEPEYFEKG
ncbi:MAG: hypothetical protein PHN56_07200 [Candidatus Nanoarchaeia archaeon]|nr:hypothetical protein [Candidatus Nanoarchaeia archaeon]